MKWGLVALNGKVRDANKLSTQIEMYTNRTRFDFVVGVDGGCSLLKRLTVEPDLILGDFDSIDSLASFEALWPDVKVLTFPAHKDYTDSELAIEMILKEDVDRIVIIGALGGRMDHMLGTLFLMDKSDKLMIIDENNIIERIIAPFEKKIKAVSGYVSLVPSVEGLHNITLKGFKYPLIKATLLYTQTRGISNEVLDEGEIKIESGAGYLIYASDEFQ